jgi:hypothetical protein
MTDTGGDPRPGRPAHACPVEGRISPRASQFRAPPGILNNNGAYWRQPGADCTTVTPTSDGNDARHPWSGQQADGPCCMFVA